MVISTTVQLHRVFRTNSRSLEGRPFEEQSPQRHQTKLEDCKYSLGAKLQLVSISRHQIINTLRASF
jgi:hypothetical protein